jgi:hypothetical protein
MNILHRSSTDDNTRKREYDRSILEFDVSEFFSFGSPLSLVIAYRRMLTDTGNQSIFEILASMQCHSCFVFSHSMIVSDSSMLRTIVQSVSCL